jgi:MscS family membrane protein
MNMETLTKWFYDVWAWLEKLWAKGIYGVDIGLGVEAFGIFIFFMLVRRIFTRFVLSRLDKWYDVTDTRLDDMIAKAIYKPIRFVPVVIGIYLAVQHLNLSGKALLIGENLSSSLVLFNIFWLLFNLVKPLVNVLQRAQSWFTLSMILWIEKAGRFAMFFIGLASVLELWGIEVAPLIAGLGLFGVAVALGAQDMFKNLIAGMLIIAEKRFGRGDWILVDGVVEGTVENIGFRSTVVRRFDKAPVYVPNTQLSDHPVTNFSAMTHRRIYWKIGLTYTTTVAQLQEIRDNLEKYIAENPDFAKPPEVATFVHIDSFNSSSIDIMLYCFTKTTVWGKWLEIKEQLAYETMNIVHNAGSSFAFPSQSVYVESIPGGGKPEIFVPPDDSQKTATEIAALAADDDNSVSEAIENMGR